MNESTPLLRLEDEPIDVYHKRLVYGKLVDKSLADYDYTELSTYVYGKEYSADVARRMMYGSCKTLELMDSVGFDGLTDSKNAAEIKARTNELRRETQRLYDQRREYNKLLVEDSRRVHLYDVLEKAANELNETVGQVFGNEGSSTVEFADSEAVLFFADWHYGMKTDNIFNCYDTSICKKRVEFVTNDAIEKLRLHRCHKLSVVVLGDLIHGAINTSARVASEELVCDQIMQVSEILAQAIERLSACVDTVEVFVTYGNHARTVANKKESVHRDNMERIVPWWLEHRLSRLENVFIVPDDGTEFLLLDICGHSIAAAHGDLDNVRTSPNMLSALFRKNYGIDLEYIVLADKHHRESFDELGCTATICGSLCGSDDYANSKRLYSLPSQLLIIVDERHGVDAEYHIKCN